eukprot:Anaeramoba_flamelloidesa575054_12.p1 GENE.a575054_12~~a575054_12.p1  ORF type:complete len:168 (+),score=16.84 a575054_12:40-543(+)
MDLKSLFPLLKSEETSTDIDFFVSVPPTKIFRAHKLIVSSNSPFFRKEFYSDGYLQSEEFNSKNSDNVRCIREKYFIRGISATIFSLVLDYCYCKPIRLTLLNAPHLLVASHRFGISALKQQCLKYLLPRITKKTCLIIYDRLSNALSNLQLHKETKKEKKKSIHTI